MTQPLIKTPEQRAAEQMQAQQAQEQAAQARAARFAMICQGLGIPQQPDGSFAMDHALLALVDRVQNLERAVVNLIAGDDTNPGDTVPGHPEVEEEAPTPRRSRKRGKAAS